MKTEYIDTKRPRRKIPAIFSSILSVNRTAKALKLNKLKCYQTVKILGSNQCLYRLPKYSHCIQKKKANTAQQHNFNHFKTFIIYLNLVEAKNKRKFKQQPEQQQQQQPKKKNGKQFSFQH